MIELTLLGTQSIRADGRDVGALAAQPKRFALLAFLVVNEGDGYHRRDSLLAMFWPDMDQFASRRALRNTLYHLRETLGDGVIITQGDDAVAVDPTRITSDVNRFLSALLNGKVEDALACYNGELLAGIHVANVDNTFEDWLAGQRRRLSNALSIGLRALTEREEKAGNIASAALWAQRACDVTPGDEGLVRRALSLFEQANDRGSALELYQSFARRLAADFNATPSAETEALVARLRASNRAVSATSKVVLSKIGVPPTAISRAGVAATNIATTTPLLATDAASNATQHALEASLEQPSARSVVHDTASSRRKSFVGLMAVVAAAVMVIVWMAVHRPQNNSTTARHRVLVAVFENRTGDNRYQSLGRMAEDWLTQGIWNTNLVDVVDPRVVFVQGQIPNNAADPIAMARKTGANIAVSGSYYLAHDSLIFEAAVIDVKSGQILRAIGPVETSVASPVAALDVLRSRVMTALASAVALHVSLAPDAHDETPAYEAYELYVEGWDAFWHGDGKRSEQAFLDAARRDTLFSAAVVAAAMAASNYKDCRVIDSIASSLRSRTRALRKIDQLSMQIAVARCRGQNDEMLRLTLERADFEPQTSSLRLSAAAAALWANRPRQAYELLKQVNPDVDLAWSTDTTHFAYFSSSTEALHLLGRHDEELTLASRVPLFAPLTRVWLRGRALAALLRTADVLSLVDSSLALPAETSLSIGLAPATDGRPQYAATPGWVAVWIARELVAHGDSAGSKLVAGRAINWYRSRVPEDRATTEERLIACWAFELHGDIAESRAMARALAAKDSTNVDYRGAVGGLAAQTGNVALADSVDRWLAAQAPERVSWSGSFYRARDQALTGRANEAIADVRESIDRGAWPFWLHIEPAFISLRSSAEFQALLKPRG
ncbi:MAG: BTAD domain-containing putative transcriptional regulator [Gemmatimonadaceae bacterium]